MLFEIHLYWNDMLVTEYLCSLFRMYMLTILVTIFKHKDDLLVVWTKLNTSKLLPVENWCFSIIVSWLHNSKWPCRAYVLLMISKWFVYTWKIWIQLICFQLRPAVCHFSTPEKTYNYWLYKHEPIAHHFCEYASEFARNTLQNAKSKKYRNRNLTMHNSVTLCHGNKVNFGLLFQHKELNAWNICQNNDILIQLLLSNHTAFQIWDQN